MLKARLEGHVHGWIAKVTDSKLHSNKLAQLGEVVMAQLVELSLPKPDTHSSNLTHSDCPRILSII